MSTASAKPGAAPKARRRKTIAPTNLEKTRHAVNALIRRTAGAHAKAIVYRSASRRSVDAYAKDVATATPMQIVAIERDGVPGSFIKDLSKRLQIPASRLFRILGLPKATADKKVAAGAMVTGRAGQAAIGMVKLLGIAQRIVADSRAVGARTFDAGKWLGEWIERPQPALGGRKPSDLLDTPTGTEVVTRLLGSLESGAYQ